MLGRYAPFLFVTVYSKILLTMTLHLGLLLQTSTEKSAIDK